METCPKPDLWRQPVGAHLPEPRHSQRPDPGSGLDGREAGAPGAGEGSRAPGGAGGRWAGASAARGEALSAERGGKRCAAPHEIRRLAQGTDQLIRLRQGGIGPAGRGRRPPGGSGPGGRRRRGFLPGDGARDRRTGGFAGEAATSPFDLVSIPAAWTPSTRPFDRDTGPSGDTARVTQSAAVCRHFPARASALHPNSRLCPTLTGAAIRRSA
jgi:hypothetical protein